MKKNNLLYGLVIVLIVTQITSFTIVSIQFSKVNSNLEFTKKNLTDRLNSALEEYNQANQRNFNEIATTIAKQESSLGTFQNEIKLLKSGGGDFSSIIEESIKGVVSVATDKSVGTGFVVNAEGFIVTNQHVINGANRISVMTFERKVINAVLVGEDKFRDLALLKIEGNNLHYLELADSDNLQIGRKVIAIGNPLGLSFSVTEGIISGLDREGPNGLREYIQTDVSLNPGNSGGPLISNEGKVIGINNFKIGNADSLGFALESNAIEKVVNGLTNQTII